MDEIIKDLQMSISILNFEIVSIRKDIAALNDNVRKEVEKQLGDKLKMIDAALTDTILQKEVLFEKGLISREEINKKYKELK
jgi:hypothetical protein